jgi:hypothetical protein
MIITAQLTLNDLDLVLDALDNYSAEMAQITQDYGEAGLNEDAAMTQESEDDCTRVAGYLRTLYTLVAHADGRKLFSDPSDN